MADQNTINNGAGINTSERTFTQREVEQLIAQVTKCVRETQLEEADKRQEGSDLPVEIFQELEDYSSNKLQRALQKFKRHTHKYNNKEWVTPETTNPNFVNQLKETKVDTLQLVVTSTALPRIHEYRQKQQLNYMSTSDTLSTEDSEKTYPYSKIRSNNFVDLRSTDLGSPDNKKMKLNKLSPKLLNCPTVLSTWKLHQSAISDSPLMRNLLNNTTIKHMSQLWKV
ncbi:hypothetical protein HPULCUR_009218 [Helicostylum pulchrum]|uniref:Uncharacterized protein n=1 Tax=Helicostylum pulchrum TaxID=562976 RepID=A0ABP9Y9U9_9FUNG